MKLVRTIAALAMACAGTGAWAADWRLATATEAGLGYVDADSVRRDGDRVAFTVTVVFYQPGNRQNRSQARYEGDCAAMTARPLELVTFRPDGSAEPIPIPDEVRRPETGTNLHTVLDTACRGEYLGSTIPDVEAHAAAARPRAAPKN